MHLLRFPLVPPLLLDVSCTFFPLLSLSITAPSEWLPLILYPALSSSPALSACHIMYTLPRSRQMSVHCLSRSLFTDCSLVHRWRTLYEVSLCNTQLVNGREKCATHTRAHYVQTLMQQKLMHTVMTEQFYATAVQFLRSKKLFQLFTEFAINFQVTNCFLASLSLSSHVSLVIRWSGVHC